MTSLWRVRRWPARPVSAVSAATSATVKKTVSTPVSKRMLATTATSVCFRCRQRQSQWSRAVAVVKKQNRGMSSAAVTEGISRATTTEGTPKVTTTEVTPRATTTEGTPKATATEGTAQMALLSSRRLLAVAGPDAAKFLQGVITANIQRLAGDSSGFYTAFLNAQGRVLHDVFIYRDPRAATEDAFLVEVDAAEAAVLERHIRRYKLRAQLSVRQADELSVWQVWGGSDKGRDKSTLLVLPDARAPGLGWRVLVHGSAAPSWAAASSDECAYRAHRYRLGVPEGQRELVRGQALPLESNMDLMGGIDFHKGCYVGQELTIRTRHRGVVRKRVLPCVWGDDVSGIGQLSPGMAAAAATAAPTTAAAPLPGTSIGRAGKKGRSAGKWLDGIGRLGLGLCRLEIMTDVVLPGEAVAVAAETAAAATETAVPTDSGPAAEFVMALGGGSGEDGDGNSPTRPVQETKVRAFVPEWLRQRLAETAPR